MKNEQKIYALANALAECGIESEITQNNDEIVLTLAAFNCVRGGDIVIEVGYPADATDDEVAEIVAYSKEEEADFFKKVEELE